LNGDGELFRPAIRVRVTVFLAVETLRYLDRGELALLVPELVPELVDPAPLVPVVVGAVVVEPAAWPLELLEGGVGG
jgi:hypothetical protein